MSETTQVTFLLGQEVRNIKTGQVGVIEALLGADIAIKTFGDFSPEFITCRAQDVEPLNMEEFKLAKTIFELRSEKARLAREAERVGSELASAEDKLISYLQNNDLQGTKPYAGIGRVEVDGMRVYPSITEVNKESAYQAIKDMGRGEIIKETIHPATLTALVTELIDTGKKVPESIGYFLKPKLSFKKK